MNDVGGGGVLDALGAKPPKMSSNDLSPYGFAMGGDAKAPIMSVLPVRLKKGLLALEVEGAGLAT